MVVPKIVSRDCWGVHELEQDKFVTGNSLGSYQHMEPHSCAQEYAGNYRGSLGIQMDAALALHQQGKVCGRAR